MSDSDFITQDKLKALIDINARITSNYSDIDATLVYILESAMRLVDCESSSLLLFNAEDDSLRFKVALGPKGPETQNIPVSKNSIAGWVIAHNESVIIDDVATDQRFSNTVQQKTGYISKTMVAVPLRVDNLCVGAIELINKTGKKLFTVSDVKLLELLSAQAGIAYKNAREFKLAKDQISFLRENLLIENGFHPFISRSKSVRKLLDIVENAALTTTSVLITGESGVGKELFAEQLHLKSPRIEKPFVRVNCAALNPSLLESELFGHVKGAFTDANKDQKGRFEMADGGTLFLDEIGEIPLELQSKLLRVLQDKRFERVGSSETLSVDVRIIAATNKDIKQMVESGQFRADLYYRLKVVELNIPPLRERRDDIEPLANMFIRKFSDATKKNFAGMSPEAMEFIMSYSWPGNIRELENSIERACVLGQPPLIRREDLGLEEADSESEQEFEQNDRFSTDICDIINANDKSLKTALTNFKKVYVTKILEENNGNQTAAAKVLDIQRTYLARLLSELGIR